MRAKHRNPFNDEFGAIRWIGDRWRGVVCWAVQWKKKQTEKRNEHSIQTDTLCALQSDQFEATQMNTTSNNFIKSNNTNGASYLAHP